MKERCKTLGLMTETLMPGGGVARRPLHFIVMADCSGSMKGEKMQALPAILLVTDGLPTDPPGGFESGLASLLEIAAGRSALRLAVAIGRDANSEPLDRFRSPDVPVLIADGTDEIADRLVTASIAVSRMSEIGVNRGALAEQLNLAEPTRRSQPEMPTAQGGGQDGYFEDIL
jgi:uncharacterized protein YegL